ncbi:MAG: group II intron maturase-specific domain-containing protein [Thermotogota bacterium]|nr:group II intron maturase-specific domain-containing protein [Thermotogota bacterium]
MNVETMIKRLNRVLRGWANYFRMANCKRKFSKLMQWIRRRLRMKQMREWKSWKTLFKVLRRNGYTGKYGKISMTRWRNSSCYLIHQTIPNKWFDETGLINLETYKTATPATVLRVILFTRSRIRGPYVRFCERDSVRGYPRTLPYSIICSLLVF